MHGGSAPQVKAKAAERLREGVLPMLATLYRLANDESVPPAVQLAAVRDWLDRSGIKEAIQVEVEVRPWERLVEGILAEVPDGSTSGNGPLMASLIAGDAPGVLEGVVVEAPQPLDDPDDVPVMGRPQRALPTPGDQRIPSRRSRSAVRR